MGNKALWHGTYQRDPVGVEGTYAQLLDKLRACQKQKVQVEEVLELMEQHLWTQKKEVQSEIFAVYQSIMHITVSDFYWLKILF